MGEWFGGFWWGFLGGFGGAAPQILAGLLRRFWRSCSRGFGGVAPLILAEFWRSCSEGFGGVAPPILAGFLRRFWRSLAELRSRSRGHFQRFGLRAKGISSESSTAGLHSHKRT